MNSSSIGQIFDVEDDEVDFDDILNAPLPKVPAEVTYTAHWLAVEGVQPTIPQNPAPLGMFFGSILAISHHLREPD